MQTSGAEVGNQIRECQSPAAAMQRGLDALRAGLVWWVGGIVPEQKWRAVRAKLVTKYAALALTRQQAWRARKNRGHVAMRLVALHSCESVDFLLLAEAADPTERWSDGRREPPRLWGCEAVRQTRPGSESPVWTWRFAKGRVRDIETNIKSAVRQGRQTPLAEIIDSSKRWPGFSGIRRQHRQLGRLLSAEWKRSGQSLAEMPAWPRLRYLQRIPTEYRPRLGPKSSTVLRESKIREKSE